MEVDGISVDETSLPATQERVVKLRDDIAAAAASLGDSKASQTAMSKFGKLVDKTMPPDLGKAVKPIAMEVSLVNKVPPPGFSGSR